MLNLTQIASLPVDAETLRRATRDDRLLSHVLTYVQRGWPSHVDSELKGFASKKTELSVEVGCLLWGMRVVVPKACQEAVLEELHASHPGIVKMTMCGGGESTKISNKWFENVQHVRV